MKTVSLETAKEEILKQISDWSRPEIEDLHDRIGNLIEGIFEDENC